MAVSGARAVAYEILLRMERDESFASELLHSDRYRTMEARDHGLATELVMGVLRWRSLLDQHLAGASSQKLNRLDGEVLAALRLGGYQLQFLSRVPARAAIFESVELVKEARKRSAASFVNAVLRKIAKEGQSGDVFAEIQLSAGPRELAGDSAHPLWLVERWVERYGLETTRKICAYDQRSAGTAISVKSESADAALAQEGVEVSAGLLVSTARRVTDGNIVATRAYKEGEVSIQDEASQLVALLACGREANKESVSTVLDCCAAPGGKTSFLAHRNPRAKVFATELHPHRARLLRTLCRLPNVNVVAADARHLPFSAGFDRILADVPCSGTGTLARNPEIKWRLTIEDLANLQSRQVAILKAALRQLATGGRLIYSTCSLEPEENEAVVATALDGTTSFRVLDLREELEYLEHSRKLSWKDISSLLAGPYLRTIPGIHPCDGFFAALIERR